MAFGSAPAPSSPAHVLVGASIYIDRLCGREAWLAWPVVPCRVSLPLRKGLRVRLRSRKWATEPTRAVRGMGAQAPSSGQGPVA
jgi:hypothetical protein